MAHYQLSKKIAQQFELIATSFHEAGHATFTLLHKMKVPNVEVFFNKKTGRIEGNCDYEIIDFNDIKDTSLHRYIVECEIGIKYAGLSAEKYHFKTISGSNKFPLFLKDGSSGDTLSAAALIKKNNICPPGKKRYQYKKKKIKEVSSILEKNWEDVILIAHSLFAKKKLTFLDLKKILICKSKNKKLWKEQFKIIERIFSKLNSLDEKEIKFILSS